VRQNVLSEESGYMIPAYTHHQSIHYEMDHIFRAYSKDESESKWLDDKNPLYFMLTTDYKKPESQVL
jgi:hypothetical protein